MTSLSLLFDFASMLVFFVSGSLMLAFSLCCLQMCCPIALWFDGRQVSEKLIVSSLLWVLKFLWCLNLSFVSSTLSEPALIDFVNQYVLQTYENRYSVNLFIIFAETWTPKYWLEFYIRNYWYVYETNAFRRNINISKSREWDLFFSYKHSIFILGGIKRLFRRSSGVYINSCHPVVSWSLYWVNWNSNLCLLV